MSKSPRDRCVAAATELIDAFIEIIVGHPHIEKKPAPNGNPPRAFEPDPEPDPARWPR